jgi:hypothetical protein
MYRHLKSDVWLERTALASIGLSGVLHRCPGCAFDRLQTALYPIQRVAPIRNDMASAKRVLESQVSLVRLVIHGWPKVIWKTNNQNNSPMLPRRRMRLLSSCCSRLRRSISIHSITPVGHRSRTPYLAAVYLDATPLMRHTLEWPIIC